MGLFAKLLNLGFIGAFPVMWHNKMLIFLKNSQSLLKTDQKKPKN